MKRLGKTDLCVYPIALVAGLSHSYRNAKLTDEVYLTNISFRIVRNLGMNMGNLKNIMSTAT